ncbi:hypothetical protein [uncultured Arcticibacterium sp.]|uniref:hypothetical protein n=1 Tax=uncultured Arcticibacterium sp. TaxID=2173042 RepID=UPI0030FA8223
MKKIILLLLLSSIVKVSLGQSIVLDPSSTSLIQGTNTSSFVNLYSTSASSLAGLRFYENNSFRGALFYDEIKDGFNLSHSSLSAGYFWARNGRGGIGTFEPEGKLHIYTNGTTAVPQLRLTENNNGDGARITFSNFSSSNDWTLYGKTNDVASNAYFNIFNSSASGNILTVRGDGKVGILNSDPTLPFHVNSGIASTSSSTGAAAIGTLTGLHLIFDNNEINAYNNTAGATLILNDESNGLVVVGGSGANESDFRVEGFTELGGSGAPSIKMKKLSGIIPLSATSHSVAHGLTKTKILGVQCLVESSVTGNRYLPNDGAVGSTVHYEVQIDNSNIVFQSIGSNMDGEPFSVLITYEE